MKKYLLTSAIVILVVLQGFAQRFDYENTSKIFFGLNIGSAWHTSDVENAKERFPLGAGFVFGGSINQNYGNAVSFDLRFRYLGGTWYGKDSDTTSAILNNYAVNPIYDSLGYTVQNFRAAQHRFALELSMHANRFKERTGIDPYIFGGIGITASNINGDLLNNTTGKAYPYNETPNGSIIDEKYETPIDMNVSGDSYTPNEFDFKVLPSLGVGIGYYFNNRFSMGVEHKTTFYMDDYFDGTTLNQEGRASDLFKNDLYHYTSIYFKWYLKSKKRTWETPVEDKPIEPENPIIRKDLPVVDFTNPSNSPHRTNSPTINLRAKVQNVALARKITFTDNQRNSTDFTFNSSAQDFRATVKLNRGLNTFYLEGENQFGKDSDVIEIYYEEIDRGNPPVVKITNPTMVPYYINQLTYTVRADIQNVNAKNMVKVYFNDKVVTNFSFNTSGNDNFSIPLNLNAGTNTLRIEGRNDYGQDTDEAIIIYKRETNTETGYAPIVNILTPSADPFTTVQQNENIVAKVENVSLKQNIEVRINGVQTNNFSFSSSSKIVQFNAALNIGINIIRVSASNSFGNDYDETQIVYRSAETEVGNPPIVNILTPNVSPYTTDQLSEDIIAKVDNIDAKQQVEVLINGSQTNNFTFNSGTGRVEFTASLKTGTNTIRVSASNSIGNDFDETQIIYRRGSTGNELPPVVEILTPSVNPLTTSQLSEGIYAKVENVSSNQQIEVRINGVQTTNFAYSLTSKRVQFNATLNAGTNIIRISASNAYGNDYDETQIIYRAKTEDDLPPVVNILTPNVSPYTTDQFSESVIAKVENVTSKQQIDVKINDVPTSNFTFDTSTKRIQFTATLKVGANTVKVSASTANGNDFDETQIIYREKVDVDLPPVVNILTPNVSPFTTEQFSEGVIAKVENVTSKQQIEVRINGAQTSNFIFNMATNLVQFTATLKEGSNTVKVSANTASGNDFDEGTIIYIKKPVIKRPFVSFTAPQAGQKAVTATNFNMIAKVENVTQKSEIAVLMNGRIISANDYSFNTQTKIVNYASQLQIGENTFTVSGKNEGGKHQASAKIERKKLVGEIDKDIEINPCKMPTIRMISPSQETTQVDESAYNVKATIQNIKNVYQIKVYLNGTLMDGYNYNSSTKIFTHLVKFVDGRNTYVIKITNDCGTIEKQLIFNKEPEETCGVKIEMINRNTEFCLTTTSGTITSSDIISNKNFSYTGQASSIYFKASANGKATVNGVEYNLVNGNYYHFVGIINVDISRNRPGLVGQWSVCVESVRPPLYGKGSKKPTNPCAKPVVKPRPTIKDKPDTRNQPELNEKTTIQNEGTIQKETTTEPSERRGIKVRNPDGI